MRDANHQVMIDIQNLKKSFGDHVVLKDISMQVTKGSVVAMIGPSGSGKSTLLRCINLLTVPEHGSIRVGEQQFSFSAGKKASTPLKDRELAKFRTNTGLDTRQGAFPRDALRERCR